ncbi:hypothetical protein TNCV_4461871 [Trichonephila clavipes]|nr:hypothetical protein TNCV_4461871 [Trichonephila clavipes]
MPRAHQAGFSRQSLAGVGFFESVRCHGPGLALMTYGGVQQQQQVSPLGVSLKVEYVTPTKVTRDVGSLLYGRSQDNNSTIGPSPSGS